MIERNNLTQHEFIKMAARTLYDETNPTATKVSPGDIERITGAKRGSSEYYFAISGWRELLRGDKIVLSRANRHSNGYTAAKVDRLPRKLKRNYPNAKNRAVKASVVETVISTKPSSFGSLEGVFNQLVHVMIGEKSFAKNPQYISAQEEIGRVQSIISRQGLSNPERIVLLSTLVKNGLDSIDQLS